MATQLRSVEDLLGVPGSAGPLGLAASIERGLPVRSIDRVAKALAPGDAAFKYRIVPRATLDRRRQRKQRLTSEEGNRLARIAKVLDMALAVYRDEAKARAFLSRPHPMLENKAPVDVALATGPGADAVVNLLGRIVYGATV